MNEYYYMTEEIKGKNFMLKMMCCIAADILALIYLLWPFDVVPDIMPVVGFIDDLIAILAAVAFTIKMVRDRFKDSVNKNRVVYKD